MHPPDDRAGRDDPQQACDDIIGKFSSLADLARLQNNRRAGRQKRVHHNQDQQGDGTDQLAGSGVHGANFLAKKATKVKVVPPVWPH